MASMIEIKMAKCLLLFTLAEFEGLLAKDPGLWTKAIQRGKAARRALAYETRQIKGMSR